MKNSKPSPTSVHTRARLIWYGRNLTTVKRPSFKLTVIGMLRASCTPGRFLLTRRVLFLFQLQFHRKRCFRFRYKRCLAMSSHEPVHFTILLARSMGRLNGERRWQKGSASCRAKRAAYQKMCTKSDWEPSKSQTFFSSLVSISVQDEEKPTHETYSDAVQAYTWKG